MSEEEKASGISPEFTELDQALEDIIDRAQEAQHNLLEEGEKIEKMAEKERVTAEDVRKRSMERLGETKEREKGNEKKKQRRSNCLEYFKEKHDDKEIELRREEIKLRKREMAIKEKEVVGALDIEVREEERKARDEDTRK